MWNNLDEFAEWYKNNRHPFNREGNTLLQMYM